MISARSYIGIVVAAITVHSGCWAFLQHPKSSFKISTFHRFKATVAPQDNAVDQMAQAPIESWSKNINLRQALATYGSNLWIVSEEQLGKNCRDWVHGVARGDPDKIWYPIKANPSPAVLEILANAGIGAECSSAAEVHLSCRAGFVNHKIMYNSPAPDSGLALEVLLRGGNVVVDSVEFLREMDELLAVVTNTALGKILVRVNPSVKISYKKGTDYSDLTAHADMSGKFGIPSEEVIDALRGISSFKIDGLHVHVGTQMDHSEPFVLVAKHLQELADQIAEETQHKPRILDLGGGLGIPFSSDDNFPSIQAFAASIHGVLESHDKFEYWFEPGHALVGNAVGLLGKIEAKKRMRGREWAIADVGFDQVMKISLLGWTHPVLGPSGTPLPTSGQGSLGGPLCFAGDVVLQGTDVSALQKGDPIFIQHTGAYCGSCANTFNGRRSGGTVVLKKEGTLIQVCPPALVEDEPLAKMYSWGVMSPVPESADYPIVNFETAELSSRVLVEDVEKFSYLVASHVGPSSFEYTIQVDNKVSFCSMPLLSRIAADACIVSIARALGKDERSFPVWGRNLRMDLHGMVSSKKPLNLRVGVSAFEQASSGLMTCTLKFVFNDDEGEGTIEATFKEEETISDQEPSKSEPSQSDDLKIAEGATRVIAQVACVSVDDVKPHSSLVNDLNVDSIDRMKIVVDMEDEWSIFLSEEALFECETVGDVLELIMAQAGKGAIEATFKEEEMLSDQEPSKSKPSQSDHLKIADGATGQRELVMAQAK